MYSFGLLYNKLECFEHDVMNRIIVNREFLHIWQQYASYNDMTYLILTFYNRLNNWNELDYEEYLSEIPANLQYFDFIVKHNTYVTSLTLAFCMIYLRRIVHCVLAKLLALTDCIFP
jgi:hypothetical protein